MTLLFTSPSREVIIALGVAAVLYLVLAHHDYLRRCRCFWLHHKTIHACPLRLTEAHASAVLTIEHVRCAACGYEWHCEILADGTPILYTVQHDQVAAMPHVPEPPHPAGGDQWRNQ